jgi:hypothetical protein
MRLKRLGSSFSMKTALGWEFGSENHAILSANNASAIRRALENAGVELIEENGGGPRARLKQRLELIDEIGGGPGVRLRKPGKERHPK